LFTMKFTFIAYAADSSLWELTMNFNVKLVQNKSSLYKYTIYLLVGL